MGLEPDQTHLTPAYDHVSYVHHYISYLHAIILGLVQGIAEPFPISSLGHDVVLPRLLGWHIDQNDERFLTFLVALHLATALVYLALFIQDWVLIVKGFLRSLMTRRIPPDDVHARLAWLLIVATIPAGIIGLALQEPLRRLFASPALAAAFLIVNGIALIVCERLRQRPAQRAEEAEDPQARARARAARRGREQDARQEDPRRSDARLARLSVTRAAAIGVSQAAALIPGISRSGFTMGGGLLAGLSNEDAARFAFLLSTPIIGAAAVVKLPHLLGHEGDGLRGPALVGGLCAAVVTVFAVKFLLRFFRSNRLTPFGIYCIAAGVILTIVFAAGG